jgi:hypothetical protein
MKRVASDQRLKDMASANSLASSSEPGATGGSTGNLAALANGSSAHLGFAMDGHSVTYVLGASAVLHGTGAAERVWGMWQRMRAGASLLWRHTYHDCDMVDVSGRRSAV